MKFPASFLDDIRARVPISSVVGRRVSWDRRKTNPSRGDYWACCPFHNEKTPSFHADDRKGIYHCFGCKASGDVFTFLTQKDGLSFAEAVRKLADEAGLPLPTPSPEEAEREEKRASLYDVMEMAARFFELELYSSRGLRAREYLSNRGLAAETQHEFRLGYAPDSRSALREHLAGRSITVEQMIEAGLLVSGEDIPVAYDRFRDRIMFPIRDLRGRVIAFGGRALSKDAQAKYLNSPETPLFRKGSVLYNLDRARSVAHETQNLFVVEGYMDVIALHRAGVPNSVAPLGTALTDDHLTMLWRIVSDPVLCFDGDEAGRKAAFRVVDLATQRLRPGYSLKFVEFPEGLDPDDVLRTSGASALRSYLNDPTSLIDMLWKLVGSGLDTRDPDKRSRVEAQIEEWAKRIADPVVSRHYRTALRTRFWEALKAGSQSSSIGSRGVPKPVPIKAAKSRFRELINFPEWELLSFAALSPSLLSQFDDQLGHLDLQDRVAAKVLNAVLSWAAEFPDEIERGASEKIAEIVVRVGQERQFRIVFGVVSNKVFSEKVSSDSNYIYESFVEKLEFIRFHGEKVALRPEALQDFENSRDSEFDQTLNQLVAKRQVTFGNDDYVFFDIASEVMRNRERVSSDDATRFRAVA